MSQETTKLIDDEKKLYEECGEAWRYLSSWREKIFAGYLTVIAGLAIAFSTNASSHPVRAGIFAAAILVSAVFWILDFRNVQLINACQLTADRFEGGKGGYSALNTARFEQSGPLAYGLAINVLVVGVAAAGFVGLWIELAAWSNTNDAPTSTCGPFFGAIVFAVVAFTLLKKLAAKQRKLEEQLWRKLVEERRKAQADRGGA